MATRVKNNPYAGLSVSLPEPWVAIRRPGVRLCLGEPAEVITSVSRYCVPFYALCSDKQLTQILKTYAHYFHTIKGTDAPDIFVAYLSLPRFMLAFRTDFLFRALVLTSPLCISEG